MRQTLNKFGQLFLTQSDRQKPLSSEKPITRSQYKAELKRFTEAFGIENGTRWFLGNVSFAEAQRLHNETAKEKSRSKPGLFSSLFKRSGVSGNVVTQMTAEAAEAKAAQPDNGEPVAKAICSHCEKGFEPKPGPDGIIPAIVQCPKCGNDVATGTEDMPTSDSGDGAFSKLFHRRPD